MPPRRRKRFNILAETVYHVFGSVVAPLFRRQFERSIPQTEPDAGNGEDNTQLIRSEGKTVSEIYL